MLEPDDLARLMGLCDWRVGAHRFAENQVLWAHSLWLVEVQPSFHDHWVIAGVAAEDWRPNAPVWRKAVMAQGRATAVIEVDRDPVAEVLNAVPLLPTSMGERLDGIGYHVRTETVSLRAEFWFANPHVPQHVALERALRELGERIAAANQASLRRHSTVARAPGRPPFTRYPAYGGPDSSPPPIPVVASPPTGPGLGHQLTAKRWRSAGSGYIAARK